MQSKMVPGMMVIFTENTDLWCADWHYIDELCYDNHAIHKMEAELVYRHGHNARARAEMLGYGVERGKHGVYIPKDTLGRIQRYKCYHVDVPLELPSWVVKKGREGHESYDKLVTAWYAKEGRTRPVEIVKPYKAPPPDEWFYMSEWWAISIQMWPVEKYFESTERHHRKYFRGIGLVGENKYGDRLPDYLEGATNVQGW